MRMRMIVTMRMMKEKSGKVGKFIDLTGKRFGRLIIIRVDGKDKHNNIQWLCICDCGNKITARAGSLKNCHTQSCGCWRKEESIKRFTQHGHARKNKVTRIFQIWQDMIQRCNNPNNKQWKDYGGRGITVCKRWRKFENFLKDMGEAPKGLQIDRINNDKGYYKSNCRWATKKEQMRNKRNNRLITCFGKTQCIAAWAEEVDIKPSTLFTRLRRKWTIEKALTTPVRTRKGKING
ncbi:hypothetical protein LCGC14_0142180 [marine sediment metagenome]|uniref:Uncharacterized protein n=1 Tax=marine sediment metagenome TaxID=412755 RepID=A0A0F9Y2S8_9ZZZZ